MARKFTVYASADPRLEEIVAGYKAVDKVAKEFGCKASDIQRSVANAHGVAPADVKKVEMSFAKGKSILNIEAKGKRGSLYQCGFTGKLNDGSVYEDGVLVEDEE